MADYRFNKKIIRFLTVAAVVLFVAGLLQTSFFQWLDLFGTIPDLTLILVCGVAFYLGPVDGALLGLVGGVILEALGGYGLALSPLWYLVVGVGFGALSGKMFRGKFWHFIVYMSFVCCAKSFYTLARVLLSSGADRLGSVIFRTLFPEFFATLFIAILLFVPVRTLAGILRGRMDVKKGKGGLGDR
jgi:uncharacterized membrane protein